MTNVVINPVTTETAWKEAIREIRASGVRIRQNVMKCCRSCIEYRDMGLEEDTTTPYGYTFGGQGGAYSWVDGVMVTRESKAKLARSWGARLNPVTKVYFNWSNGAGRVIADVFARHGFKVDWDGNNSSCVVVNLPLLT